ncbi:DUF2125 domain-containing protein [Polymorphum gilvum]|uniref:DUF2125 domain-containing protein n=1 Tax=Polymorphum gilvum (strain LMG 25793 / CGMCC 1.9160 / SL003B-26A1) TaxID=991905 RepID=F2IZF1_POLGS|nr:DUF2125 domain-containing protein [Polymorphum gilvum]ADZ68574.1 hypothetical protein SL003B_0135 [Polymorphum gilvum SL003B-26A1]
MSAALPEKKNLKLRYILLSTAVVVVIAGWSAAWAVARGFAERELDAALAQARAYGFDIGCEERSLAGWPFRFELTCTTLSYRDAFGNFLSFRTLRAVALVYNPRHLILEVDGPASAFSPGDGPTVEARWDSLRASLRIEDLALSRFDAVVEAPEVDVSAADGRSTVALTSGALHLRADPAAPANLQMAVSFRGLGSADGEAAGTDGTVVLSVPGAAPVLGGVVPLDLFSDTAGQPTIDIDRLRLESQEASVELAGRLTLDRDGHLNGELPLMAVEPERLQTLLAPLFGTDMPFAGALQGAVVSFGRPETVGGRPAVSARLVLKEGMARVGVLPIAALQPLY